MNAVVTGVKLEVIDAIIIQVFVVAFVAEDVGVAVVVVNNEIVIVRKSRNRRRAFGVVVVVAVVILVVVMDVLWICCLYFGDYARSVCLLVGLVGRSRLCELSV